MMRINKSDLVNLIEPVVKMADKTSSMTALGGLLLWTEEGKLKARATDLTNDITRTFMGSLECEDFKVLVPADKFFSVVKALPEGEIDLNFAENQLVIKAGESEFELTTWSPEDFPSPPSRENGRFPMFFSSAILADTLEATIYAVAQEKAIYSLSGLCFDFLNGEPGYVVATDGHRLACCELHPSDISSEPTGQYIIPRKTIRELIFAFKKTSDAFLQLTFSDSRFIVSWEKDKFQTELSVLYIEGSFPDWRTVSNPSFTGSIMVNPKVLIEALKRTTLLINDRFKPVTLIPEGEYLVIKSRGDELGSAQERISAKFEGEVPNITVNAVYLIDALKPIQDYPVKLEVGNEQTPIRITLPIEDGVYMALVMPMSI